MDNKTLDGILVYLAQTPNEKVDTSSIISEFKLNGNEWNVYEIELLNSRGLVRMNRDEIWHAPNEGQQGFNTYKPTVQITPSGIRFVNEGGFTAETRHRDETLQVAKDSRKYARWAFWISLAGVLVTIAIYLLGRL